MENNNQVSLRSFSFCFPQKYWFINLYKKIFVFDFLKEIAFLRKWQLPLSKHTYSPLKWCSHNNIILITQTEEHTYWIYGEHLMTELEFPRLSSGSQKVPRS